MNMMNSLHYLTLDLVNASAKAAASCYKWIGRGDEKAADLAAVESLRDSLNSMSITGTIAIGEGERDKAPMLYIGEKLGQSGVAIDIAVDPLEGTTTCAHNKQDALSVLAVAPKSTMMASPDIYMEKIAIGAGLPRDLVDLDEPLEKNLSSLAKARKKSINELNVIVLRRDRHSELIKYLRSYNVQISLIEDGDVLACLRTCLFDSKVDMYIGTGGAPEGILAASALKCLGGQIQCRLVSNDQIQINRALAMGITDLSKKYSQDEMLLGETTFIASWVTDGLLRGVRINDTGTFKVNSLVLSSNPITVRIIETTYK